jgi:Na+/proline symporter
MAGGSEKIAVRACIYAAVLYLTIAMLPLFISLCTKHLYPDQITGDTQLTLPRMVLAHTSLGVQVVFFGSLLSAIMSTTSSAVLAPAAILSENIIKPVFNNQISDQRLLYITRISVLFFSAIATVMACLRTDIYELVGESSIVSLVSLFAPLTLGLYWKKSTAAAAVASMFTGIISWLFFKYYPIGLPELVPATMISFVTMLGVSLIKSNR